MLYESKVSKAIRILTPLGRKHNFFLYHFMFMSETPVTKDKLTREKGTNLFKISFVGHKKRKTRRNS